MYEEILEAYYYNSAEYVLVNDGDELILGMIINDYV